MDEAPFTRICAVTALESDGDRARYRGVIDPIWTVGRKPHGGTMIAGSAAAATQHLRSVHPNLAEMFPVSASTDFLGSPDPGEVEYEVRIRKTGRQICVVDSALVQSGRTMVHSVLTFAHLDDGEPAFRRDDIADMPVEPPADAIVYEPDSPMGKLVHVCYGASMAIDPTWARFIVGETGGARVRMWIRPREADGAAPDVAAYFAMMAGDICPPTPLNMGHRGWAPTVQLTTYLRRRPAPGWLRVIGSTQEVGARLFDEDQLVVDSTGAVVVQTRQLAMVPRSS
ncbi:MAG: thioesterase family protein [Nocardia sp.]|nr:thioesterase family protein [Nocardia sp.]